MNLESENYFIKKVFKPSLKNDVIAIEILNDDSICLCDETTLLIKNLNTNTDHVLFTGKEDSDEFNSLKYLNGLLFVSNDEYLQLFDVNNLKPLSKYKFCKETINSIELNKSKNSIALCDDSGDIKLLDLRIQADKQTLTLKKKLNGHSNICSTIKFNDSNENELYSGSFDCSILKWDLRTTKTFANKINVSEILSNLNKGAQDSLASSMTPCFVHSIHLTELNNETFLLAGIENGLCFAFKTDSFKYLCNEQIQTFNCALTQLDSLVLNDKMKVENNDKAIVGCGNGKAIEFFYLNQGLDSIDIKRIEKLKINHESKINSAKYSNRKLFVADTSSHLTIYDFN